MGSSYRVDEEGEGSSKRYFTDYEVKFNEIKPLSRHGSSDSYSSSASSHELLDFLGNNDTNIEHDEKTEQSKLKSSSSSEMHVCIPNRIPSSVFSTKHSTQMDWSAASNESLFSIHINNCSYSKDQFFMLYKSGELTKLDEQIIAQKDVLPSLKELDDMAARDEHIDQGSGNEATEVETGEVAEDESEPEVAQAEEVQSSDSNDPVVGDGAVVVNLSMEKKPTDEAHNKPINSLSNLSEESNISISFTFPVLTVADGGRLSSACAGQNNKGFPAQQQPPQRQPQEEEEEEQQQQKEFTKEMEPENSFSPQNDSTKGGTVGHGSDEEVEVDSDEDYTDDGEKQYQEEV